MGLTLTWLSVIILIPLAGLFLKTLDLSLEQFWGIVTSRRTLNALKISFGLSFAAACVNLVMGTIVVWALVRYRFPGRRLFDAAALHARNRGIDTLFIHALSENRPMLRIAAAAGAVVERDGAESAAWLRLPPDTVGSQVEQALDRQLGELDFQLKRQAQMLSGFVESVAEVKAHFDAPGRPDKE